MAIPFFFSFGYWVGRKRVCSSLNPTLVFTLPDYLGSVNVTHFQTVVPQSIITIVHCQINECKRQL